MSSIGENRESFFNRIKPFFSPKTLLDVELAYTLAKYSHRAQVRKELDENGNAIRYFEHVKRVAIRTIDDLGIANREIIISALLHDGLEDTRDITSEMIEYCFGSDVVEIVKTLSKVPKEGYLERFNLVSGWRPYVIKACDRLDNLKSMSESSIQFREKQVIETREKYYPLFDRMIDLCPQHERAKVIALRDAV